MTGLRKLQLSLLAVLLMGPPAIATPLEKDACETLKGEQAKLTSAGIATDRDRGPDWAKTHATADRLKDIARLIEVEEQLSFRCRTARVTPGAKKAGEAAAAIDAERAAERAAKKKKKPPADADSAAASSTGAETSPAAPAEAPKPARKKKAKPKPKTDDAYSPPPGSGAIWDPNALDAAPASALGP